MRATLKRALATHSLLLMPMAALFGCSGVGPEEIGGPSAAAQTPAATAATLDDTVQEKVQSAAPASLLIITSDAFASYFSTFQSHKTAIGTTNALLSISQVRSQFPGYRDDAEAVKHAIESYYRNNGTKYVLLGGDSSQVPVRYRNIVDGGGATHSFLGTDFYYGNLYTKQPSERPGGVGVFETWDSNGNGLFNETKWDTPTANPDSVEGYPDIAVGRIPAWNTTVLQGALNKIIAYENLSPTVGGPGFPAANRYLWAADACYPGAYSDITSLSGGVGAPPFEYAEETQSCAGTVPSGYTTDTSTWGQFTAALQNPQCEFTTYVGHGGANTWGYESTFNSQVSTLTNPYDTIAIAAACQTAEWTQDIDFLSLSQNVGDYDTSGGSWAQSNIGTQWLTNANGGAVAYIGETEVLADGNGTDFTSSLFASHAAGTSKLGDQWLAAQRAYFSANYPTPLSKYQINFSYPNVYGSIIQLLGDPSMLVHGTGFGRFRVNGGAGSIGVGPHADAWLIGTNTVSQYGNGIYHLQNNAWTQISGAAKQIAVSPDDVPWVIDNFGNVYKWNGSAFAPLNTGCATSIGVGPNGQAWIIGCTAQNSYGNGVYHWVNNAWQQIVGPAAKTIAVGPDGTPWVVDNFGNVYKWNGSAFAPLNVGCATSIGVGPNGEAWVVGCGTAGVYHWQLNKWWQVPTQAVSGTATTIAVSPEGTPWLLDSGNSIYEYN